jgi:hypothetical protein
MPAKTRSRSARKSGRTTRPARRGAASRRKAPQGKKWSARVTQESDALTLERGVFTSGSAKQIAASLKRSAERSRRRKAGAYQSAMSMLNFYINRGGRNLPAAKKRTLNAAKEELRRLYGRD